MKKKILTRAVCVMLSQEMYRQLSELTDQQEISVSDYIRFAVQERLIKQQQSIIRMKKHFVCLSFGLVFISSFINYFTPLYFIPNSFVKKITNGGCRYYSQS